jgi:hypothetical protein
MKITTERKGTNLTNVYHISATCLLRHTVGKPIATLISKGISWEVREPCLAFHLLRMGRLLPARLFPHMDATK